MQLLEAAARHALQLTGLEDLAAWMGIYDDAAAVRGDAASGVLLLLWFLGLGGLETLTSVDLPYRGLLDVGMCLFYFAQFPALTILFMLVLFVTCRDPHAQLDRRRVRMTALGLYLVAVVARVAWENLEAHAWVWTHPWTMAAIAVVAAGLVQGCQFEHPDAHDGHLASFHGTYSGQYSLGTTNAIWLLVHAALRSYAESSTAFGHYFASTFAAIAAGLVAHRRMVPARSVSMPYDLQLLFCCLAPSRFGWSYLYSSCRDSPLTFLLAACGYVFGFGNVWETYAEQGCAPCFGTMAQLHQTCPARELDSDSCSASCHTQSTT